MLEDEAHQKEEFKREITMLQSQLLQLSFEADETRRQLDSGNSQSHDDTDHLVSQVRHLQIDDGGNGDKTSVVNLFEQVGLQKIIKLLEAEEADIQIHAVKVVANLVVEVVEAAKMRVYAACLLVVGLGNGGVQASNLTLKLEV